jgi:CBS domain-containing protein
MSREVVCVRPDLDAALLLPLLTALDVKALTVVDDTGRPLGMVSRADALEPRAVRETVDDVMVCMAFSLRETVSLSQAAALMAYESVHRLPVVSAERQVVGVISALDVVGWLARNDGYLVPAPAVTQPPRFDFLLRIAAALARPDGAAGCSRSRPAGGVSGGHAAGNEAEHVSREAACRGQGG